MQAGPGTSLRAVCLALTIAACSSNKPVGGDGGPGDGAAGTTSGGGGATGGASGGATGSAGSGGTGGATASGAHGGGGGGATGGSGGATGGGPTCGTKTCVTGGKCCYACISQCAGPGEACPEYLVDPCATHDAGAGGAGGATGQACTDKGPACPGTEVCDLNQPGRCAASTAGGTCIVKPEACPLDYTPVCGCDGKTYGNDCERQSMGAQLNHAGAC